jgi:hypothetical protein
MHAPSNGHAQLMLVLDIAYTASSERAIACFVSFSLCRPSLSAKMDLFGEQKKIKAKTATH